MVSMLSRKMRFSCTGYELVTRTSMPGMVKTYLCKLLPANPLPAIEQSIYPAVVIICRKLRNIRQFTK